MTRLVQLVLAGEFATARKTCAAAKSCCLIEVNFIETNPGTVKAAMG